MNWIKKTLHFGEKIKRIIKKRASKEEIANSDWTSCCKGPILKKDLEENLWVCSSCNKHHRISPRQRFDVIFGQNNYEVLKTPIPQDDPLNWSDSKSYKDRLSDARKKTGMDCGMMVISTNIKNINITAIASDFNFIGGSIGAANASRSKTRSSIAGGAEGFQRALPLPGAEPAGGGCVHDLHVVLVCGAGRFRMQAVSVKAESLRLRAPQAAS